jgi:hypothetical protein
MKIVAGHASPRQRPQFTLRNLRASRGGPNLPLGRWAVWMAQESGPLAGQPTGEPELSFEHPGSNAGRAPALSSGSGKDYVLTPV